MNSSAILSLLTDGLLINTRLDANNEWFWNIISEVDGNTVTLPLLDGYIRNIIMPGSSMAFKYSNEYFEYLFEGNIIHINLGCPSNIVVHINKAEELINTRAFPRFDLYLAAQIKPLWQETPEFCITTNISLGGMAFVSKYHFDYGDESDIKIYISNTKTICAKGKVIRRASKGALFDYSMQFTEIDNENRSLLSQYFMTIEEELSKIKALYTD